MNVIYKKLLSIQIRNNSRNLSVLDTIKSRAVVMVLKLGGQANSSQIIEWAKHTLLPKFADFRIIVWAAAHFAIP